jgi:hypothetical protein
MTTTSYKCSYCKININEAYDFCPNCKYPIKGTEKEQSIFIGQQILKKGTIEDANIVRKNASYILLIIGIVNVVSTIFWHLQSRMHMIDLIVGLFVGIVFIFLSRKARKVVYYPFVIGFILLLLIYIINGLVDTKSIIDGIGLKIAYLGFLIYGFYITHQEKIIKKEHNNLNVP